MIKTLNTQPSDPYDTAAWLAFYEENPGFNRSVGAEGVNDDDDTGGLSEEDKAAAEAAEKEAAEKKAAEEEKTKEKPGMSDSEAELLKDAMKHKQARKDAEAALNELKGKLEGVDLEEYQQLIKEREESAAAKKKAEEDAAIARGDFDKVRSQMSEQHEAAMEKMRTELTEKLEEREQALKKASSVIEELTVGSQFSASKFIADDTIYTPTKARRLYGDHFEVEEGKIVAYDAPRGSEGRSPLVDSKGNNAGFEEAMRRIIESDPEKDEILVAKMRPGAQSQPGKSTPEKTSGPATSRDKIKSGITDLMKNIEKPSDDSGFKL